MSPDHPPSPTSFPEPSPHASGWVLRLPIEQWKPKGIVYPAFCLALSDDDLRHLGVPLTLVDDDLSSMLWAGMAFDGVLVSVHRRLLSSSHDYVFSVQAADEPLIAREGLLGFARRALQELEVSASCITWQNDDGAESFPAPTDRLSARTKTI